MIKKKSNERKLSSHVTASCVTILNFILLCGTLFYIVNFHTTTTPSSISHNSLDSLIPHTNINVTAKKNGIHDALHNNRVIMTEKSDPYSSWCPKVKCEERLNCNPCQTRFLFILGQDQSGSTTLMNMINYLPGIRIRDRFQIAYEREFFEIAERLSDVELLKKSDDMYSPFSHHKYPVNHLMCTSQNFIHELNPPKKSDVDYDNNSFDSSTIIGFKEVYLKVSADIIYSKEICFILLMK